MDLVVSFKKNKEGRACAGFAVEIAVFGFEAVHCCP